MNTTHPFADGPVVPKNDVSPMSEDIKPHPHHHHHHRRTLRGQTYLISCTANPGQLLVHIVMIQGHEECVDHDAQRDEQVHERVHDEQVRVLLQHHIHMLYSSMHACSGHRHAVDSFSLIILGVACNRFGGH